MLEITQENFEKEVLKSGKPVLVDFWAPWCMPCKIIAPHVEKIAGEMKDKVVVAKANVDDSPELATNLFYNFSCLHRFKMLKTGGKVNNTFTIQSVADLYGAA